MNNQKLLYGRTLRGPMSILRDLWTKEGIDNEVITTYQFVFDLRNRIEETCTLARENLLTAQQRYKKHFDKTARLRTMDVGERVLVMLPTDHNKLLLRWKVKVNGSFYIAQYPVRWTAQSALHFLPSLADLFIPTPTRLLREAF